MWCISTKLRSNMQLKIFSLETFVSQRYKCGHFVDIKSMQIHRYYWNYHGLYSCDSCVNSSQWQPLFVYRDLPSTVMLSTTSTGFNFTERTDERKRSARFSEPHGLKTTLLSSVPSSFCHTFIKRVTGWQLAKHKCSAHDPLMSSCICGRCRHSKPGQKLPLYFRDRVAALLFSKWQISNLDSLEHYLEIMHGILPVLNILLEDKDEWKMPFWNITKAIFLLTRYKKCSVKKKKKRSN